MDSRFASSMKAAGVDQHDIGAGGVRRQLDPGPLEISEHGLAVDQVFGAAQADHPHPHWSGD